MQRKTSKNRNGRQASGDEKRFHRWLKEHDCVWCGNPGPSIVDHCKGATFSHNKVHIGHWFCLPQCVECDTEKTIHGKRLVNESQAWHKVAIEFIDFMKGKVRPPSDVMISIHNWGK